MDDPVIFGVQASALILVLVEVAKTFGMPGKYARPAALIAALAVFGAYEGMLAWPVITPYIRFVFEALWGGMAAIGLWHATKTKDAPTA